MWKDPDFRQRHRAATLAYNSLPESKAKRIKAALKSNTKDTREKKRQSALNRKPHSEETKAKMRLSFRKRCGEPAKNQMLFPRLPQWKVCSPNGEHYFCDNLIEFCITHQLYFNALTKTQHTLKPVPPPQRQKKKYAENLLSTIGWWVERLR